MKKNNKEKMYSRRSAKEDFHYRVKILSFGGFTLSLLPLVIVFIGADEMGASSLSWYLSLIFSGMILVVPWIVNSSIKNKKLVFGC